ncbi:MAG: hypothetical protein IPK26_15450 [Planctomycetes bacterium]|nr:hypothetical protein [Planctomycetota bacterium]
MFCLPLAAQYPGDPSGTIVEVGSWGATNSALCPLQRCSGVNSFVDRNNGYITEDDVEYFVLCRSDGIFVIDVTPTLVGGNSPQSLRPRGDSTFIEETGWKYLGPNEEQGSNGPIVAPGGNNANLQLWRELNGVTAGTWPNITVDPTLAYCGYPTPPPNLSPVAWSTKHTTNREAVVMYDEVADKFFIYSVSTQRDGVWVIPLVRQLRGGGLPPLQVPDVNNATWDLGSTANPIGHCHMIYLDAVRKQLWLTDDTNGRVLGVGVQASGSLNPAYVLDHRLLGWQYVPHDPPPSQGSAQGTLQILPVAAHDIMPVGLPGHAPTHVYITYTGAYLDPSLSQTLLQQYVPVNPGDAFPVQASSRPFLSYVGRLGRIAIPTNGSPALSLLESAAIRAPHSICAITDGAQPNLWLMQEEFGPGGTVCNATVLRPLPGAAFPWEEVACLHCPTQVPGSMQDRAPMHHLRNVRRTGFVAQYTEGVGIVDLSEVPPSPTPTWANMPLLARFDTDARFWVYPPPATANKRPYLDRFLGTWDVAPHLPSGLLLVSAGENGGLALQVTRGHLNRYSSPTLLDWGNIDPIPIGPALTYPDLALPDGPARLGKPVRLRDVNVSKYPTIDSVGRSLGYAWTFAISPTPPALPSPATTSFTGTTPGVPDLLNTTSPLPATGTWNLGTTYVLPFSVTEPDIAFPASYVASMVAVYGSTFHVQIVVEQFVDSGGGAWTPTGRWMASRGAWLGVMP